MITTLTDPTFSALAARLHAEADASKQDFMRRISQQSPEEIAAWRARASDYRTLYLNAKDVYLAVSPEVGRLLYILGRSRQAHSIVEFGTSFGVATLYLAAAVRDNGGGLVIGSEFEPGKAEQARRNLDSGGLGNFVEIRDGDALDSLADNLPDAVDLLFLDGAKQLYLPILRLVETHLAAGALLIADDVDEAPDYLEHVRDHGDYISTDLGGDLELSVRTVGPILRSSENEET